MILVRLLIIRLKLLTLPKGARYNLHRLRNLRQPINSRKFLNRQRSTANGG